MRSACRILVLLLTACTCVALSGCADEKRPANSSGGVSGWRSVPLTNYESLQPFIERA